MFSYFLVTLFIICICIIYGFQDYFSINKNVVVFQTSKIWILNLHSSLGEFLGTSKLEDILLRRTTILLDESFRTSESEDRWPSSTLSTLYIEHCTHCCCWTATQSWSGQIVSLRSTGATGHLFGQFYFVSLGAPFHQRRAPNQTRALFTHIDGFWANKLHFSLPGLL